MNVRENHDETSKSYREIVENVKKKGSSNTSNVDLSSVSHSKLNKDVKRYSRKDLLSCNNSHLGETSSAYVCNDAMNVSCNSRLCDSFVGNNLFIFDDESVRISPVSKTPFRKKPRDSMNVRSKSNSNKSLPKTVHRWLPKMQPLAEPIAKWIFRVERDKLVCWSSKKQNCVSISTAESEFVAVSSCCAQVLWMRTQLMDYGFFYDKVPIYCDSKSAIAISCNPVQHTRTKHIDVSAKETKREVFGMPIPNDLITDDIRGEQYYNAYLKKLAKHQRYLAGEEGSDPEFPTPKPAKATKKSKRSAPKADLRPPVKKPASSKQPKPKPAPAKSQEKKHLHMDDDMAHNAQVHSSDEEDTGNAHIPKVTIQSDFFFNKDLEYLRYGSKDSRHALSISKMKATYYPDVGLEQMMPDQMWIEKECKYDIAAMYGISHWWFQRQRFYIDRHTSEGDRRAVQTHIRILSVVKIEVFSMCGYDYMKKIVLRRADLNEHIIAEGDFKYLYPSDFEDMYLLNLQGHLNHLPPKDKKILTTAVNLWTRHLIIRQCHDFMVIDSPRAVTFRDKYGVQMIMRFNEMHKFSDGTLHQIDEALDYRVKEFKVKRMNSGLNTRFWTKKDVDRSKEFMFTIQKRLKTRRIFCNLESFVGGRVRDGYYRLLHRTK
nr:uncharacterized mitochondrial protein AtMg00810-like [Tanacetum cinerariifolium]